MTDPLLGEPADQTKPTRRRLVLGGAVLGAAVAIPGLAGQALAAVDPVLPGLKPEPPFRLGPGLRPGMKPGVPPRPEVASSGGMTQTQFTVHRPSGADGPMVVHNGPATRSVPAEPTASVPTSVRRSGVAHRGLWLDNVNTGETLKVAYLTNGRYQPEALKAINWLMRDRRTDEVASIDLGLLDLLNDISQTVGVRGPLKIISGYRSPETNAAMRATNRAVARKSYHTRAMAADIAIPGVDVPSLFRVAVNLGRGGVGDYPRSGFVHVDVGPPRTW